MIPKTLVDVLIWIGCYVYNYAGKMNEYSEFGDETNVTKYVLVPLKSSYQRYSGNSVPTVSSSELNAAVDLAYSTAGLQKNPLNIPCSEPYGTNRSIHYDATSYCELWDIYYFSHVRYCTLENVSVS